MGFMFLDVSCKYKRLFCWPSSDSCSFIQLEFLLENRINILAHALPLAFP
jgi:hypothetical protein